MSYYIPRPVPERLLPLIKTAAELRADGHRWGAIAAKVNRNERSVRRWKGMYPDVWERFYYQACAEALQRGSAIAPTGFSHYIKQRGHPQQLKSYQAVIARWVKAMLSIAKTEMRIPPASP